MLHLRDLVAAVESAYPRQLAADWDSVGVIAGGWDWPATRVLVSVDINEAVLTEAIHANCQVVLSHHPLWLARHSIREHGYKARLAARALSHGIALLNAHTNADHARPGVSDALADLLGLTETLPIEPHPLDSSLGTGRVGVLPAPLRLNELRDLVEARIPAARSRMAGDPGRLVRRVAVCAGAGDSLLSQLAAVDVYITSDLRHHVVAEHLAAGGCAVIDIDHAAAESLWLPAAVELLRAAGFDPLASHIDTSNWLLPNQGQ